jgi:cytoskeletal protein CcmA (bactofilin family)
MFRNSKKAGALPPLHVDTLIGARTTIVGDVRFSGGLHVDGTIRGMVVAEPGSEALLVLSEKGMVDGEIHAPHVVINGQVKGDIVASERVELAAQARVDGNIYYKLLEMAAGADVNGRIVREDEPRKQLAGPDEAETVVEDESLKPVKQVKEAKRA